ncbi:3-hydroxyacyl-ACP dehydratase FabZ family protein [Leuconostoc gelidum]|uniref:Hydroxymyristoyl-ACP dehydratase n=1 Tax=Leuconostoc gelidum subsp. gelidum TaxID=1607839 RepID=A0ABS7V248_LEUGE|nr:hydroxymyristoyl-ACP dehydratase [Leuconostoc gelidum]AFS39675.1 (3R)-hydroxymyristoyl-ACP dehydratase [Leuconostoc gelidum JB7]MBZ5964811.1 hydroxymyristoyl-ACP dehydratase [Leuconostoc gelidum subsp. gelidum]MBZ5977424.1 hydroxymyristoyl-ACP dehydratase [Leuconostoc gelidum subsp. gelidum]MBZ5991841.1 hydroxymyristoyl-ACP dehydratase [Leuconostoc gelidum subsp. gelidum]MBZ5999135.1 hydroxymyristoyl-ACP dehydratase [Leuconostoc gelidum subsp. gelidum]
MQTNLNSKQVSELLPQKEPFRFVTDVIELDLDLNHIKAHQIFGKNEIFFQGHFPNKPIVPGVLLIECMAQTALILLQKVLDIEMHEAYLVKVVVSTFYSIVKPNDNIFIESTDMTLKGNFWEVSLKIKFETNKKVAKATLLLKAGE